jgi:hypothetical protein
MLSTQENVALSNEIDATSSLFRHGFGILKRYRFSVTDAEAMFVCLAGGAEKLLKLTDGLIAIGDREPWPDRDTMKKKGHRIVVLDAMVHQQIVQRSGRSSAPGLIGELLERRSHQPAIDQILGTLERYATDGRFYNLDLLGRVNEARQSPQQLWRDLESSVIEANPELLNQLASSQFDPARSTMNGIIAVMLGHWCELIVRSWITGVCGDVARQWSSQLDLGHLHADTQTGG